MLGQIWVYITRSYLLYVMIAGILIVIHFSKINPRGKSRNPFPALNIIILLSLMDLVDLLWNSSIIARTIANVISWSVKPVLIMHLWLLIRPESLKKKTIVIPLLVNSIVVFATPWTHLHTWFSVSSDGSVIYHRGPLQILSWVILLMYALQLFYATWREYKDNHTGSAAMIFFGIVAVFAASVMDIFLPYNQLFLPTITCTILLLYLYVSMQDHRVADLEQQLELEHAQQELALSQVQPHFLYNTLATIRYLIKEDPALAAETVGRFSKYLRTNMNSVGVREPVPFSKEIEHVQNFAHIQMLRFDNIKVDYDLKDEDFLLPAITIQPLVENSIKHGVRNVENGQVHVRSYFENGFHVVEVSDNGVGFDPSTAEYHVGIHNVEKRLKTMVNGTMEVKSAIGQGTTTIIRVPEEE